jgi:capsular exopolysaccharide synthesis family protein
MNEPPAKERSSTHDRYAWRAQVMSRLNRLKTVLTTKWWMPLAGVGLGLGIQGQMWRNEKPLYTSSGRMIVSIKLSIPEGSVYTEELNNFLGTQAALMQSGVVLNRAYAAVASLLPNLPLQPVPLRVTVLPKTTIFLLQGSSREPRYSQAFVQACMDEYVNLKKDMRAQTSDTTIAGLTEEVLRLKKELLRCDQEIVAFQASNSVVVLQEQGNSAGNFLAGLNQRLAALKSEYALLQTLTLDQNLERQQQGTAVSPAAIDSASQPSPAGGERSDSDYLKANQQILLLKAEQEDWAQNLRPEHPKMIALSEEIVRRERLLNIFHQQSSEQLESRKNSLKLQIDNLEQDVRVWDAKTLDVGLKTAQFQQLKANSQRIQALYDRLLATMQTLDVNKEISPESVNIMEKASAASPEKADLGKMLLIGALAGLGCSLFLLVVLDRLDDRINSLSEVTDLFDETILGQIPRETSLNSDARTALLRPDDDRHSFMEAYRNLRSALLYSSEAGKRPTALLVTSSVPDEGKSVTSANLAITLANAGSRVLLVDADLRKGTQHSRFDLPSGPGLSEALAQGKNWVLPEGWDLILPVLVRETTIPRLSLLPRGSSTPQSSELFLSTGVDGLLKHAATQYDFIIVDSAPVMAADDVTSLAPHMDGVLFVLRAEFTSARVAHTALDALYQRQVRVLGLVFNAIRPSSLDYYYYHKYKNYYNSPSPTRKEKAKGEEKKLAVDA